MSNIKKNLSNIIKILETAHPNAHCELNHSNPFELLCATILSAQCTDVRVNMVTPNLFKEFPTALELSKGKQERVEEIIHSTGFYKNKAKNLIKMAETLTKEHRGEVPKTMDELVVLPGVGRKTANVILGNAFNINYGIVVDTHVMRISKLLGLTKNTTPEKIEIDLMKIVPRDYWTMISHLLIFHGRRTCIARRPKCDECTLQEYCHYFKVQNKKR